MKNYRIYDQTGSGVTEDIEATDLADAIDQGKAWMEAADWEPGTLETTLGACVREIVYHIREAAVDEALSGEYWIGCQEGTTWLEIEDTEYGRNEAKLARLAILLADIGTLAWDNDGQMRGVSTASTAAILTPHEDTDMEIDEDATDDGEAHDCSIPAPLIDPPDCCHEGGHDYVSPFAVVGGIKDNPGVYGSSHGGVSIHTVCRYCGCHCHNDTGATDPSNGTRCESTKYTALEDLDSDDQDRTLAWLQEENEDDGYTPQWLAGYLGEEEKTRSSVAQQFRDFAADEAQDVSHGVFEDAISVAEAVKAGKLGYSDAMEQLQELRKTLEEAEEIEV